MIIRISGKPIKLQFTLAAMEALEQYRGAPLSVEAFARELQQPDNLVNAIRILAGDEELTAEWLKRHIRPGRMVALIVAVLDAVTEGLRMDALDGEEDGQVVDVTLEELLQKKTTA